MKVPLRALSVNFQSIKMKQCRLSNIPESVKPDAVIGTVRLSKTLKFSPKDTGYIERTEVQEVEVVFW